LTQSGLASDVKAGGNAGKRLSHDHVVRAWRAGTPIGVAGELRQHFTLPLPAEAPAGDRSFAETRDGDVLQAHRSAGLHAVESASPSPGRPPDSSSPTQARGTLRETPEPSYATPVSDRGRRHDLVSWACSSSTTTTSNPTSGEQRIEMLLKSPRGLGVSRCVRLSRLAETTGSRIDHRGRDEPVRDCDYASAAFWAGAIRFLTLWTMAVSPIG